MFSFSSSLILHGSSFLSTATHHRNWTRRCLLWVPGKQLIPPFMHRVVGLGHSCQPKIADGETVYVQWTSATARDVSCPTILGLIFFLCHVKMSSEDRWWLSVQVPTHVLAARNRPFGHVRSFAFPRVVGWSGYGDWVGVFVQYDGIGGVVVCVMGNLFGRIERDGQVSNVSKKACLAGTRC